IADMQQIYAVLDQSNPKNDPANPAYEQPKINSKTLFLIIRELHPNSPAVDPDNKKEFANLDLEMIDLELMDEFVAKIRGYALVLRLVLETDYERAFGSESANYSDDIKRAVREISDRCEQLAGFAHEMHLA